MANFGWFWNEPGAESRKKAEKYGKLADKLESEINELTTKVDSVEKTLNGAHETFTANPDSAEGYIITTFEVHEGNWKGKHVRIITQMRIGIQSLKTRKAEARQWETYWNQMADMEVQRANAGV